MQITIEVSDENINGALEWPHSRYWATEASWDPGLKQGHVVDGYDDGAIVEFDADDIAKGLALMAAKNPSQFGALLGGDGDGVTGDVLLQFAAFGEERYG